MKSAFFIKSKRGLTLIELLITVFIFSIVLVIISTTFVRGFMVGRVRSSSTKDINRDLNLATALISQKMTNANATAFTLTSKIYGFKKITVTGGDILAIASSSPSTQCTYFGIHDSVLYMKQDTCSVLPTNVTNLTEKITTGTTNITAFELSGYSYVATSHISPYVTVNIIGEDPKTGAKVTLHETYSLNYAYNWLN